MMKTTDDKIVPSNGQAANPMPNNTADQKPPEPQETKPEQNAASQPAPQESKPADSTEAKPAEPAAVPDDRPTIAMPGGPFNAPPKTSPVVTPASPAASSSASVPPSTAMPGMSKPVTIPTPSVPVATPTASSEAALAASEAKPEVKPEEAKTEPPAEAKPQAEAPKRPAHKPIEPTQAHVLVVEDNVPNFVLIARMLAYMGVQRCEWKTSGWQVVEFADTLPRIDLILMDIRLPYEDGFQALEKVRANPRLKNTLVVAVTAEASVDQMKRAQDSGFDGFLSKPLDPDRFPEQIRRVLNGESVWEIH